MSHLARQLALPFAPVAPPHPGDVIDAPCYAAARAWLARQADWPQGRLALWGPAACGKSLLLHDWAAGTGGRVIAGPALRFPAPSGPLAIDDADAAAPLDLLHTLNAAVEAGQPVLLAARCPPARWNVALPDLASRLRAIAAVEIAAPDDALLRALLARLLARRQLRVAESVQLWLLRRLPRTQAALVDAVARLDHAEQQQGEGITRDLARTVLPDLLSETGDDEVYEEFGTAPHGTSPAERRFL